MANRLLNGLVAYYKMLNVGASVGGQDFDNLNSATFVGGMVAGEGAISIPISTRNRTEDVPLFTGFGTDTGDFLGSIWFQIPAGQIGVCYAGQNNNDGFGLQLAHQPGPGGSGFYIPGSDGSYNDILDIPEPLDDGAPHNVIFWWTYLDATLHLILDGGVERTQVVSAGGATKDTSGRLVVQNPLNAPNVQNVSFGSLGLWLGTIPDATQRVLLFGGLPFSQFDSGAGGVLRPRSMTGLGGPYLADPLGA